MLNILKVLEYEKTVAVEYELVSGWPDTFTMTWDELLLQLPPESTRVEAVVLATLLLKQKVDTQEKVNKDSTSLLDLARSALKDEA